MPPNSAANLTAPFGKQPRRLSRPSTKRVHLSKVASGLSPTHSRSFSCRISGRACHKKGLAGKVKTAQQNIQRLEKGGSIPTTKTLRRIAKATGHAGYRVPESKIRDWRRAIDSQANPLQSGPPFSKLSKGFPSCNAWFCSRLSFCCPSHSACPCRHPRSFLCRIRRRADHPVEWSKGNTQPVTLHGDRTLIFTNGQKGGSYRLIISRTRPATTSLLSRRPCTVLATLALPSPRRSTKKTTSRSSTTAPPAIVIAHRHQNGRWPLNLLHPEYIPLQMETAIGNASRWNTMRRRCESFVGTTARWVVRRAISGLFT